ncbi:metallophosphoesterase [Mesonia sp. HuA40]|uniref:metallophosphoesterase family protein n=1 Tax=Mesonia sp. HuA40 TaxID=2602761 RepID=UPI0011C89B92|nr:metallophosphoesterase family protein [Mesonia sp. HuA40]TXK75259.1 metallophosphoesterase family protein [Mesonia sp. HuA40]
MKKILLLSDTHSHLDERIITYARQADEIWHAGDIGNLDVTDTLNSIKPLRAVYGNIDDDKARRNFPLDLFFDCEQVKVYMTHIGGYPERYNARTKQIIEAEQPQLFICGHSHILKVMYDKNNRVLHMNPGACGTHGFHTVRTMLRFEINGDKIEKLEVIELGQRGKLK